MPVGRNLIRVSVDINDNVPMDSLSWRPFSALTLIHFSSLIPYFLTFLNTDSDPTCTFTTVPLDIGSQTTVLSTADFMDTWY